LLRRAAAAALFIAVAAWQAVKRPTMKYRTFPAGVIEVHSEIAIAAGTDVRGLPGGTVLRAAADFSGRALLVVQGDGVRIHDLTIDGNRDALEIRSGLPRYDTPFARFTRNNGVLAEGAADLVIEDVTFRHIAGFAVLVSRGHNVAIRETRVSESGSRNAAGRNNTTGGILIEEGTTDFRVTGSQLRDIRGNGIWTHSLYTSPRNERGVFADNHFDLIGRDALQVGHATSVQVERNQGSRIGFPVETVDMEGRAIPVAVDTAGNVDTSLYAGNVFYEINGKCFDLDGFHDGSVRGNVCVNRLGAEAYPFGGYGVVMNNSNPDMQSKNVRIEDNRIEGAKFGCYYVPGQPDLLQAGIYLGSGAERPAPARGNLIEDNVITGWKMESRCIGRAPSISPDWNTARRNSCE
jgi:hypothetical protein